MLTFPDRIKVSACTFTPANQSVSGGQSVTGFQQWKVGPGGRWSCKMTCQVVGEEEILPYNAFLAQLQGSAVECLVTPRDGIRPRNAAGLMYSWRGGQPFSNGANFFGGGGWAAPVVTRATSFGAALRATAMSIITTDGSPGPQPGNYFGIGQRLYRVVTAFPSATFAGGIDLTFWPGLRSVITAGTVVILDRPLCRMRLAKDDSGALEIRWRQPSTPSLEFIESMPVAGS